MIGYQALPLPSGRFVVAFMPDEGGGLRFYSDGGLNGQLGSVMYRNSWSPATLFYTARDAENCAKALNHPPHNR